MEEVATERRALISQEFARETKSPDSKASRNISEMLFNFLKEILPQLAMVPRGNN
jgi:hypothetical protein